METFETVYIGNGLYDVYIDGRKQACPCELDRIGMIYADNFDKRNSGLTETAD